MRVDHKVAVRLHYNVGAKIPTRSTFPKCNRTAVGIVDQVAIGLHHESETMVRRQEKLTGLEVPT